ncbi:hypothetical protein ACC703_12915 [Rhizobium ruizarguesonis]
MPTIVFHWQRTYSQAAQIQAKLEGREPTMEDMIADGSRQPVYSFSAFAVPPGTDQERQQLRRLIKTAGFRSDKPSAAWVAPEGGEAPAVVLKVALEDARVSAVHYYDIPLTFTVSVNLDGLL